MSFFQGSLLSRGPGAEVSWVWRHTDPPQVKPVRVPTCQDRCVARVDAVTLIRLTRYFSAQRPIAASRLQITIATSFNEPWLMPMRWERQECVVTNVVPGIAKLLVEHSEYVLLYQYNGRG